MSSIYGRVNLQQQPVYESDLAAMEVVLDHWSPDRKGQFIAGNAGMGHLMLHNTIASLHEKLPRYEDELLIVSDARIDNRVEITRLLGVADDEQQYADSHLILLLYKKYHEECVNYLIGDFAFAIWDKRLQKLFCARDHMGVKPFFYTAMPDYFAFASEKKGLMCIEGFNESIDEDYLYNYIRGSHTHPPEATLYKYIRRIPAAHTLTYSTTGSIRITRYWEPDVESELHFQNDDDYFEGLKHHFEEAVSCRLRSEYKVGAELSGGLDSSGIVGAAHSAIGDRLITLSNALPVGATDEKLLRVSERKYIEAVIDHFNIKNSVFITEDIWNSPVEETDFLLKVNDGLEMWNPTWQLGMKQVAMQQNIRTILSGFPGDQIVTDKGKGDHLHYLNKGNYLRYWKGIKNKSDLIQCLMPFVPYNLAYGIHKTKNILFSDKGLRKATTLFEVPVKYRYKREDVEWHSKYFREKYNSLSHYLKARLMRSHVQARMEAETRQGIYYRTEPRFPMADIRLIQYYLSLPDYIKCMGDINRYVYRKAVKEYLPEMIYCRTDKVGNMAPFLFNEQKNKEKIKTMQEIYCRIKGRDDLPVRLKDSGYPQLFNINLLRWLDLLQ